MQHGSDAPTRYSDGRRIIRSLGLFFFCACKHATITPTPLSDWASDNPECALIPQTCFLVHDPTISLTLFTCTSRIIRCFLVFFNWDAATCTDATASVYPTATGYSGDLAPVHPVLLVWSWITSQRQLIICSCPCRIIRLFYVFIRPWLFG